MSSTAKLMLRGASLRVLKTVVSIVIGFIMMPFLVKELGEHLYGLWITIGSILAAYYLLDLGFSQAVTRYVAKCIHQNDFLGANKIINTALVIYSSLSLVIVLLTILLSSTVVGSLVDDPNDLKLVQVLVVITGVALAFEFPAKAFPGIINAYMRYDTIAVVGLIKAIADALFIYILIKNGYGLVAMALVSFVTSLMSTAFYAIYCNKLFKELEYTQKNVDFVTAKEIFHFSKWVFVIDANRLFKEKMDVWLITFYSSVALVTIYYVAVRLIEYAVQFLIQATGMASTLFTKYYALGDHKKLAWAVNIFIKINFLFGLVFLSGFYLIGYEFIELWMGKDFDVALAYSCLIILSVGKMASYMSWPINGLLLTIKRHSFTAKLSIAETIASAALSVWLIPRDGLPGAALAISAPLFISRIFIMPAYAQKRFAYLNIDVLSRLVIATAASIGASFFFKLKFPSLSSIEDVVILSLGYSCLLPILCIILFDKSELSQAVNLIRKKLRRSA